MKQILWSAALIVSFLFVYLEWSGGHSTFLFQAIGDVFKPEQLHDNMMHPLILLPLSGVVLFVAAMFSASRSRLYTHIGIAACGVLVLIVLLIGVMAGNFKTIAFSLPFVLIGGSYIYFNRRKRERT
ncbi:MAG: hypothetical protein K1X68_11805 [Saprospiraceae bacterium]|nr:hypothetical protein [Saprospiraceae bacterium]HMW40305.1 hypothetical protein [Saprospiraceae bacterium]HMX89608.1 hypothetical protein [Saprospiraceae bacterium]HMZ41062.1 hypothetical protein [Saprospiraceae bacterium]HNA65850.1 hypothetical protein [Saprospiraceae bacterium]